MEEWLVVSSEDGETSPGHAEALYYLTEKGKKYLKLKNPQTNEMLKT
ncbi:MAG: hypothetical protein P1P85_04590 [Patescibacteria group bacterium]|nr:hypothetical protein [Patescibacteria group bacterium]